MFSCRVTKKACNPTPRHLRCWRLGGGRERHDVHTDHERHERHDNESSRLEGATVERDNKLSMHWGEMVPLSPVSWTDRVEGQPEQMESSHCQLCVQPIFSRKTIRHQALVRANFL